MSVVSRTQRILAGAFAVVLLMGAVLVSLPYFLSESQIREELTRSVQAATGVTPKFEGAARLALLPRPAIQLSEVYLEDGSKTGLAVGALQATVQFIPLLFGEVKIATLTLDHPRLTVHVSPDGKILGGLPFNPWMPSNEEVPELRIVDGTVVLRIEGRSRSEIFSDVNASLSWSGATLTTTGTFMLRGQQTNASLMISDTAALGKGERSAVRLRIDAAPLRVTYEGGIAMRDGLRAEGSLNADAALLRDALRWFDMEAPSPGGFGRFSFKSKIAVTPIATALTNLAIELDGNRAQGGLTVKRDGPRTMAQGTLAAEEADLSPYRGILSLLNLSGRDWNRDPIDVKPLQAFDLDLRLSAGKLNFGRIAIGKAGVAVALKDRQLTISVGEAAFYGGMLRGTAVLQTAGAIPEFKIDASISNFDLEDGLGGLTGFRRLEGIGTMSVTANGAGTSIQEIARDLSGKAQLAMTKGALVGINGELVLRRLERRPLSGTGDLRGGRTPFDKLAANIIIEKGNAALSDLDIESAILKVKLSGDASIVRRDLDLRGVASLIRAKQQGTSQVAFDLPFMIQGSWDSPYLLPDPEALIRHSGAAAPLLDAVRGRAAREAMRNVIETVTGLQSIGELPANPTFEPPVATAPEMSPVAAPAPNSPLAE